MITHHDHYCPRCDRELDCNDYLQTFGVWISGSDAHCPVCFLSSAGIRYPGRNPYCLRCVEDAGQAIENDTRASIAFWRNYFARNAGPVRWLTTPGVLPAFYSGGEVTRDFNFPGVWLKEEEPPKPLAAGQIPCHCNICGRGAF